MASRPVNAYLIPAAFAIVAVIGAVDFFVDDGWTRWLGIVMAITGTTVAVGLLRKKDDTEPEKPTPRPAGPTHDGPTIRTGGIRVSDLPPGLRRTDDPTRQRKDPPPSS